MTLWREENISSDGFQGLGRWKCRVCVEKSGAEYWGQIQRWEEIMQMLRKRICGALGSES